MRLAPKVRRRPLATVRTPAHVGEVERYTEDKDVGERNAVVKLTAGGSPY